MGTFMVPSAPNRPLALLPPPDAEKTPGYWNEGARRRLESALALQPVAQRAKNIILFMGDGESSGSQPGSTAVTGEKMGLVQGLSSPTPSHPAALPCPQAWDCPPCRRLGSTRGNWPAALVRRASWPWRPFPMWPWPR